MNSATIIEIIGYIGSALVLVSMLMTSVVRLRIINLIGSIIFAGYALAIRSYPTAIMNICLAGINVYHLFRIFKEQRAYTSIKTDRHDGYFSYLLENYIDDINIWFPEFSLQNEDSDIAYLICCESNPACLFLGRKLQDGQIEVILDYATPAYRDTSVGSFLYKYLAKDGYRSLAFRQKADKHVPYLIKIGYKVSDDGSYILSLSKTDRQS